MIVSSLSKHLSWVRWLSHPLLCLCIVVFVNPIHLCSVSVSVSVSIYVSMIVTQAICLLVSRLVMIALSLSCLVTSRNEDSGLEHHTLQCNPATATGPRCWYSWGPQRHEGRGGMPVSHRNCTQQMCLTL